MKSEVATFQKKHWPLLRSKLRDIDFLPQEFREELSASSFILNVIFDISNHDDTSAHQVSLFKKIKEAFVSDQTWPDDEVELDPSIYFRTEIYGKMRNYGVFWSRAEATLNKMGAVTIMDVDNPEPGLKAYSDLHEPAIEAMVVLTRTWSKEKSLRLLGEKDLETKAKAENIRDRRI